MNGFLLPARGEVPGMRGRLVAGEDTSWIVDEEHLDVLFTEAV
ncbi:MAG: hypothetical protein K0Q71_1728, partial [Thermomicrobiales bacterium]|nr:hypothetical protein [Thermomicrobiales bacterium]